MAKGKSILWVLGRCKMRTNLCWFRRDLRIHDQKALYECSLRGKPLVPFFILDPGILQREGLSERRTAYLFQALRKLGQQFAQNGVKFRLFRGNPLDVFRELCARNQIAAVFFNRDYEPYALQRDGQIREFLHQQGIEVFSCKDSVLHEPGEIVNKNREPYRVFTPYYKNWQRLAKDPCTQTVHLRDAPHFSTPPGREVAWQNLPVTPNRFTMEPFQALETFFSEKVHEYATARDLPSLDGTSRLSPLLRFGLVSIRDVFHRAKDVCEPFTRQLAWRDFYFQVLAHFPRVQGSAFLEKYNALRWQNDREWFARWCAGQTGFPLVDAGMRQLVEEGWMHNRLRMLTASFLVKDLLIDWRWGEEFFQEQLLDHDLALNNGGWQWCASTGTDAQPFFRVFNPFHQSKKFDPEGIFIRKYVPELQKVPTAFLHAPHTMPREIQEKVGCRIGKDYPPPMVEHNHRRIVALEAFRECQ